MVAGVVAGYGAFASMAARFLYPSHPRRKSWLYVAEIARLKPGDSLNYMAPDGARVAVARRGRSNDVSSFIALSSVCPHLGCQVHWESKNSRFFCPCHNGAFDSSGKAVSGPPAEAKQTLPRYALKVDRGLLFIEVPTEAAVSGRGRIEHAAARRRRIG